MVATRVTREDAHSSRALPRLLERELRVMEELRGLTWIDHTTLCRIRALRGWSIGAAIKPSLGGTAA